MNIDKKLLHEHADGNVDAESISQPGGEAVKKQP
jgi:hypothetical protein